MKYTNKNGEYDLTRFKHVLEFLSQRTWYYIAEGEYNHGFYKALIELQEMNLAQDFGEGVMVIDPGLLAAFKGSRIHVSDADDCFDLFWSAQERDVISDILPTTAEMIVKYYKAGISTEIEQEPQPPESIAKNILIPNIGQVTL